MKLPGVQPQDTVIKGIALQHGLDMPKEAFTFDRLSAKIRHPEASSDPDFENGKSDAMISVRKCIKCSACKGYWIVD